jgi:sulfide:quinone oxidoreductase
VISVRARISIVGAGFAALTAARELRRREPDAEITLIAPKAEFVYLPSLIWVPFGLRTGEDLRFDLSAILARHRLGFHGARVTGISEGGRKVLTELGTVENDALLIASGGRFIKQLPGMEHALTICEGIPAEAIRERIVGMDGGTIAVGFGGNPKEPSAVRGGPMFELLFGLDTWLRKQRKRDRFELVFFSPAAEPGKRLGDRAVQALMSELTRRGITTQLGHKILGFDNDKVRTEGGEFAADLILFMPGMTGPAWIGETGLPLSPGGFIEADAHCHVPGWSKVFVAGDAGSFPGPDWMPKQAHMADLQAKAAAENLSRALRGLGASARFRVELMCIVDTLSHGVLVYRDEKRAFVLPPLRIMHWAKGLFERLYVRPLRNKRGKVPEAARA